MIPHILFFYLTNNSISMEYQTKEYPMPAILVLYHSEGNATKTMAELVAQGAGSVDGVEVRLKSIADATADDIRWCDGLACGSPTYLGIVSWQMKKWWDEHVKGLWGKVGGKVGCAFSSSGGWGGGAELTCQSILSMLINYGFMVFGLPDYSGPGFTAHYGAISQTAPKEESHRKACTILGARLAEYAADSRPTKTKGSA